MIIKFLLICLFVIYFQTSSFSYSDDILNDIEYRKYGTTYQAESLAERLCRLEIDYFGMEQQGSIDSRLDMLSKMSNNYRTSAIQQPIYNNYSIKKKSAIRRFFEDLGDTGTMTGFTPSISSTSYNNGSYYDSYGNGYRNNLSQRIFNNFLNNRTGYCPYHNDIHHSSYVNHIPHKNFGWNYNNYNHNWHNHNLHHNYHHNPAYIPPNYTNPPLVQRNFYVPPNVQSRTAVKIIKD